MSAPDLIEPFVGWKGLDAIIEGDHRGLLFSPALTTPWAPGEALVATCSSRHKAPAERCRCGVYAVKTFEALKEAGYNWCEEHETDGDCSVAVVAEVKLWGRIRVGTIGYRAELAYPQKVYVPAWYLPLGAEIRRRYGCAIGVIDRFTGRRS